MRRITTKAAFARWLRRQRRDVKFYPRDPCGCPIARYSGGFTRYEVYWCGDDSKLRRLPQWAVRYIRRFDKIIGVELDKSAALRALGA